MSDVERRDVLIGTLRLTDGGPGRDHASRGWRCELYE